MAASPEFAVAAQQLLAQRIEELRRLSYNQAAAQPGSSGEQVKVAGLSCTLTIFRHELAGEQCLLVAQVARPGFLGTVSYHLERGLIFQTNGPVREANDDELETTGG